MALVVERHPGRARGEDLAREDTQKSEGEILRERHPEERGKDTLKYEDRHLEERDRHPEEREKDTLKNEDRHP